MTQRFLFLLLLVAGVMLGISCSREPAVEAEPVVTSAAPASAEQVHAFCGACHKYPAADIFPRSVWREEIRQAYDFLRTSTQTIDYPPFESVARYYEDGAPETLPLPDFGTSGALHNFKRAGHTPPKQSS